MGESNIDKLTDADFVPASEATERGYSGYTPDDTPNEDYTVAGVTAAAKKAKTSGDDVVKVDEPRRTAPRK